MTNYGVIGDAHLGFKAYDTDRRTHEVSATFRKAVEALRDVPLVCIPGDLFDDTNCPNWVKRDLLELKEEFRDQVWVIIGGNHDSTKTYSSVSVLDAFAKVYNVIVINEFNKQELNVCGLDILAIPHTKSQEDFLKQIDDVAGTFDICMLHCMVDSDLDLSPNDLNIDLDRLIKLSDCCTNVWIGHQHGVEKPLDNVYIPGGVVEFNFGELGTKYVYRVTDKVEKIPIKQERKMIQLDLEWAGPLSLLDRTKKFTTDTIYKVVVDTIPIKDYSSAKSTVDAIVSSFEGDIIYSLLKLGHEELQVTEINASFDLLTEFNNFITEADIDNKEVMISILTDAISELLSEEDL